MKTPLNPPAPAIAAFLARHAHLVALALFAAVGIALLDDYGGNLDETGHRNVGYFTLNYILGDADALQEGHHERYYGVAFQLPLVVVERLLGLEDSRDIYLSRRLLTHLFFLAGGFFAWLLTYRLFGSRLVALFAMLIFLLHPRIYAHSFVNAQDLPFLSMFMVALHLIHRAFRRDSLWAFALCGAGVALLANVRIMGIMLFPAVLGLLALDAAFAMKRGGTGGAKHALRNAAAFIAASATTLYATWPILWRDPTELINALQTLSSHPSVIPTLFRGELVKWPNIPWDYIPTWMLITTPPVALILAALGIAAVARLCAADWRGMFANSDARFGLFAAACLILPVAGVIALNANMYNGWRHMYFLWAPLSVLAAFGLSALSAIPKPRLRAAAFALAALGIAAASVQIAALHPYQNDYFNPLADKSRLAERWGMDYWRLSHWEALKTLLETAPDGRIPVTDRPDAGDPILWNARLLPQDDRRRLSFSARFPLFRIGEGDDGGNAIWTRGIYGVPLVSLLDVRAESEAAFREAYAAARASERIASAGGFDIYRDGDSLIYAKNGCGAEDALGTFTLYAFPSRRGDLPAEFRDAGLDYEPSAFDLWRYGAAFGGDCLIKAPLPDYPIHAVETARRLDGGGGAGETAWRTLIPFADSLDDYAAAQSALSASAPDAAAGGFDIYADGGKLIYRKPRCAQDDARARFFLSVFPADPADLPQAARAAGLEHEALNFDFHQYGATLDGGDCVIVRYLPGYPISEAETGQWLPGAGGLWSAKVRFPGYYDRYRAALSALPAEPDARSDFDIWLDGGRLIYLKRQCDEGDARGRFWLSVFPADPIDLPQAAREAGREHQSLNFDFPDHGAALDGDTCVIIRELPDYPIDRIETGQRLPGEGERWRAEIAVGD